MDISTAMATRKSVRAFRDMEVPEEMLLRLLEAALLAPSTCNFQEWRFVVVRNAETRKRLAIVANRRMFISYDVALLIKNTLLHFMLDKQTDISYIL
jgi:nitroreductase